MSPKHRRGEATVDRVLTAALDLYAAQGPDALTMTALIAETGVSSGSLYHHFGSVDGLAAALYARCMADLLDAIADALEDARTARAGVQALVRAYLGFVRDNPPAAHFIHASSYAGFLPAHAARIAEAKAPRMARIAAWLRPHVAAGRIVDLPEPLLEMLVIGPVAETARRRLAGDPGIDLAQAARLLPERIWRAVRADPAPPVDPVG
ncbi:DNA-binding transcriptional regulator, AcrR family [Thermomonospora echinospora]|uniref:DNA-binding transcriptional regulator, AcrR family n=1 Tax=Thermomonospora echinospora TaxID=1992 RepID=A0A1H6E4P1_9ACTN|nr:TetR/AcrR family transcriptional regulator [Thermomonospora echinospora]SEG92587.1 DNA-binding transcriptional regulator, AcrR family [Thermomonospora echinospora]